MPHGVPGAQSKVGKKSLQFSDSHHDTYNFPNTPFRSTHPHHPTHSYACYAMTFVRDHFRYRPGLGCCCCPRPTPHLPPSSRFLLLRLPSPTLSSQSVSYFLWWPVRVPPLPFQPPLLCLRNWSMMTQPPCCDLWSWPWSFSAVVLRRVREQEAWVSTMIVHKMQSIYIVFAPWLDWPMTRLSPLVTAMALRFVLAAKLNDHTHIRFSG